MARALALAVLLCAGSAAAQAPVDLGALRVVVAPPVRTSAFVVFSRPAFPEVDAAELPAVAARLLPPYRASTQAVRAAARASATSADASGRAAIDRLVAREAHDRDALRAALEGAAPLSRPAQFLLGQLRWEIAAEARLLALEALEPCLASGRHDCVEPPPGDDGAIAAWTAVQGDDVIGMHALLQCAWSLYDRGEHERALPLLARVIAARSIPREAIGSAAFVVGEITVDPEAAVDAYALAATLGAPDLAHHAALAAGFRYARLGRVERALETLDPLLGTGVETAVAADARLVASDLVASLGAEGHALPESLPAVARARALVLGAERLAELGLFTWASADLDAATALDPAVDHAELSASIATRRTTSTETPAVWLTRAVAYCAHRVDADPFGVLRIDARLTPRGAPRIRVPGGPPDMVRCLSQHAPPPEGPLRGRFRATVTLTAR